MSVLPRPSHPLPSPPLPCLHTVSLHATSQTVCITHFTLKIRLCLSWKHKLLCCSDVSSVFVLTYRHFWWSFVTLVNLDTNVCFRAQFHHLAVLTHPGGVKAAVVLCMRVCVSDNEWKLLRPSTAGRRWRVSDVVGVAFC